MHLGAYSDRRRPCRSQPGHVCLNTLPLSPSAAATHVSSSSVARPPRLPLFSPFPWTLSRDNDCAGHQAAILIFFFVKAPLTKQGCLSPDEWAADGTDGGGGGRDGMDVISVSLRREPDSRGEGLPGLAARQAVLFFFPATNVTFTAEQVTQ